MQIHIKSRKEISTMSTGKYRKKLSNVFSLIGILFIMCIVLGGFYTISASVENRYQNTLKQSVFSNNMLTEVTLSTVSSTLTTLTQDTDIKLWANSNSRSQYYYNAIIAKKKLDALGVHRTSIPIFPAITTMKEDYFVITTTGSYSKSQYFEDETFLTKEQVNDIFHFFSTQSGELIIPYYNGNQLHEIYYFYQPTYSANNIIYILKIPKSSLLSTTDTQKYILYSDNDVLAYSHNDKECILLLDTMFEHIIDRDISWNNVEDDAFRVQNKDLFLSSFTRSNWKIAYIYDHIGLSAFQIIFYVILPSVVICFLVYFSTRKTVNWLYSPMNSVINEVIDTTQNTTNTKMLDEFEILKQNATTAKHLAEELKQLINQNNSLISQKFYRDLIYGVNTKKNEIYKDFELDNKNYCVALIEFSEIEESLLEDDIFFSKNIIFSYCQSKDFLKPVNINQNTFAIIIQENSIEEAKNIMLSIVNKLPETQTYRIAISNIHSGLIKVHQCYREAMKILEFKYLFFSTDILTAQQVYMKESTDYYYPIVTENRIIQSMIQGKENSLEMFDQLVRENFNNRDLAPESLRNFIFSLLSTINRFFQELKTSPEELLGHPIMIDDYYVNWNHPNIISDIRAILSEILEAVMIKSSSADNSLLVAMQKYIYTHYSTDIMLNDMADELGISAKYCSNLFKKLSDDNFKNFLNKYRIERAKEIIVNQPDIKITDLCTMVGFNSSNTFIRVFGKYTGTTPKAFANQLVNADSL